MLADTAPGFPVTSALIHLYVPDVDTVYAQAISACATSIAEPTGQFYGDRLARVADPHGNQWSIYTHIEDVAPEEMMQRLAAMGEG